MEGATVGLVDANAVTRKGMQALLTQSVGRSGDVVVFENVQSLEKYLSKQMLDVVLLDDAKLRSDALEQTVRQLCAQRKGLKIIILSRTVSVPYIQRVMRAGALGFIEKDSDLEVTMTNGIQTARRGLMYLSPKPAELLAVGGHQTILNGLRPVDLRVLRLMAQGNTVDQITRELKVSDRTVYRSRANLREALDVATSEHILDTARKLGLLDE